MAWSFRHHYFPYARKSTSAMRVDFDEDDFAISDLEDSTEDDEETPDLTKDDSDVLRRRVVHLPLSVEYVPRWQPQDAFRELYQNWYGQRRSMARPTVANRRNLGRMASLSRSESTHVLSGPASRKLARKFKSRSTERLCQTLQVRLSFSATSSSKRRSVHLRSQTSKLGLKEDTLTWVNLLNETIRL